jgi:hypothetical protein
VAVGAHLGGFAAGVALPPNRYHPLEGDPAR